MKNLFYFILPLIAAAAYADDYYFVGGGTPTTERPSGAWSHFVDGTLVPVDRQPLQGEDNLVFNSDYIKSNILYVTTPDNYGKDLIISNLKNDFELSAGKEVMAKDVYWDLSGKISVTGVEGVWDASKNSFTDNSKVLSFTYTDDSIDETLGGPRIHLSVGSIEMMADGTTATNIMTHKAKLNLGRTSKALSSITVQNDVKLYSRTALVMNATNIKINGIVGLYAEAWTNSATLKFNDTSGSAVTVELGGLVAAKQCAEVSNAIDAAGTSTTLIFKNAAGTDYTYNGVTDNGFPQHKQDYYWSSSAGVTLSIPLFEGGKVSSQVAQKELAYEQAVAEYQNKMKNVRIQVKEAWLNLEEARSRIEATKGVVDQARENLNAQMKRYRAGLTSQLEVNDAISNVNDSDLQFVQAVYDGAIALSDLKFAVGAEVDLYEKKN